MTEDLFPSSATEHIARYGTVLLTVYCGTCAAERRRDRGP